MEIQVMDPLPDRLKSLKGIPLKTDALSELKDKVDDDGKMLCFFRSVRDSYTSGKRSRGKTPFTAQFFIREKQGRKYVEVNDIKAKLNVYMIDANGRIVVRKKLRIGSQNKPLTGRLDPGPYLVICWIDYKKDVRLGEIFYFYNR